MICRIHILILRQSTGFTTFRLEFQVPYFALRTSTCTTTGPQTGIAREVTDLAFLLNDNTAVDTKSPHAIRIHEAMTSVVICGSDDSNWIAYAFVDTQFDGVSVDDEEVDGGVEYNEDPIASDRKGPEVEADNPIWNPREYFLRIIDLRMKRQILEEWRYIVGIVERGVKERVRWRNLPRTSTALADS
jgi:hypothetical protein